RWFRRRIPGPARIADGDAALDVAVVICLKGELVADPRVVSAALIVEGQRLPWMDEEHRVHVLAPGLQAADGEVLLGDRVGICGGWRPVVGVDLDTQGVSLERAIGLLDLEGIQA